MTKRRPLTPIFDSPTLPINMKLRVVGTLVSMLIDNVQILSFTASPVSPYGGLGVRQYGHGAAGDANRTFIDNLTVRHL